MRGLFLFLVVVVGLFGIAGCSPAASAEPTGTLTLILTAGPVCPVVRDPPDPNCAPRPQAGEVVAILEGDREIARGTSDANGRISFALPPGRYVVHPVSGGPFPVPPADQVVDVGGPPVELALEYDTGIR